MRPVEIQITSDFICPWCWIGHAHLKAAIKEVNLTGTAATIKYLPYELNPTMPKDGANRKEYRSAKFGSWARSQAMDADVTLAGKRAGLEFNYEHIEVTPNTRLAHRLMFFAQGKGDAANTEMLFEAVFAAYFSSGQDIGSADVLAKLAEGVGFTQGRFAPSWRRTMPSRRLSRPRCKPRLQVSVRFRRFASATCR